MPAVFKDTSTFPLPSRKLLVIPGAITAGTVKTGMWMRAQGFAAPVASVEFVDYLSGERRSEIALCTPYRDEEELASLQALVAPGTVLEVEDALPGPRG